MSKRPKMSDLIPHPLPGYAKLGRMVTRREALNIQAQAEALARAVARRKIDDQLLPHLKKISGWELQVTEIAADLGVSVDAIMLAFQKHDARVASGDLMLPCIALQEVEEREYIDHETGRRNTKQVDVGMLDSEKVQAMVEHALTFCEPANAAQARRVKPKRPRVRRSKEAIRKAKARAEGRVKPRPRKGPPSIEARIAAAEKSLATRRAALAALKANPNWPFNPTAVYRCESGIRRVEKSLVTWRARLATGDVNQA